MDLRAASSLRTLLAAVTLLAGLVVPAAGGRAAPAPPAAASPVDPVYFPETGHYLSGRFRQYWERNGGLAIFGYPLTGVFNEVSTDGLVHPTQYFERARFEWHQDLPQPYDVLLTLLGNEVTKGRGGEAPFRPVAARDGCGYAAPTGHTICGPFLAYWQQHGGLSNFGYPLSEAFIERNPVDGQDYTVQYFERARFEEHPENAGTDYEVLLGLLGLGRLNGDSAAAAARAPESRPPALGEIPYGMAPYPQRVAAFQTGVNAYLLGGPGPAAAAYDGQTLDRVGQAGFGWVRFQLVWSDFEPFKGHYDWAPLDAKVDAASSRGLNVLLTVVRSPAWAAPARPGGLPEDSNAFAAMLMQVTGHYKGRVQAYEIWNEPNLAGEVGGRVDPAAYTATLQTAFTAIKAVDQSALVVLGGLLFTPDNDPAVAVDDMTFLNAVYANGGGQFFDALGVHAYGAANPPEALYPDAPGPGDCPALYASQQGSCYRDNRAYYFRHVEDLRALLVQHSDYKKQIWLTEFGWPSCQGEPAPPGYEYCQLISEQQQADYIVRAFQYARAHWHGDDPKDSFREWIGVMFLWNLNYSTIPGSQPTDEKATWSLLRPDGTPRPAFGAVQALLK
ncbi:MAG TPA: cellulase family glycosylhydrolase [Thermomicrobiales bacterium]|nr:cellulase family glycosylhydrolase [Thermomicrobiales bacterium]